MTSHSKKILLVEDEPHLAFNLEFNLSSEGYEIVLAANGRSAIEKFEKTGPFDVVVLDVMLPEIDGFEVARIIRSRDVKTGILMLTARASESDVIKGLESGADDYLTKPFHLQEFLLRVRRMAERSDLFVASPGASSGSEVLILGSLRLDVEGSKLTTPRGMFDLTALEVGMLKEFMKNPGRVLTREYLLAHVWGTKGQIETRTVDNFVMRIRKYVEEDPSNPILLESVRGRGYRLVPQVDHGKG